MYLLKIERSCCKRIKPSSDITFEVVQTFTLWDSMGKLYDYIAPHTLVFLYIHNLTREHLHT